MDASFAARLKALQENPGQAGVDYDPQHITVHYAPGAQFPAALNAVPADPFLRAAAQGNPSLRANQQFEALTDAIAARYGLVIQTQVYLEAINMAGFSVPPEVDAAQALARLRAEFAPYIIYAGYSQYYQHCALINDPNFTSSNADSGPQWGHQRIRLAEAFDYTTGDPAVRIAVCDTGVRITHQELQAQVLDPQVAFPGFHLDVANNDNTMEDSEGHGTFIAGLIAAQVNDGITIAGAAYNCQVIPIKITNSGAALDQKIYEGCLLADQLGAKAINLSFGDTHDDPNLEVMVNQIVSHGHLFVGAAGNNNSQTIEFPGGYTNSLCVGATQYGKDERTIFSNYGYWVDIAAPGEFLKSCTPDSDTGYNNWMDGSGSGTSFAAPLVAAAAALLWSYNSALTNTQVRTYLTTTGAPATGFNNSSVLRLDIAAALAAVNKLEVRAPALARLIQSGTITVQPFVSANVDSVEGFFNGASLGSLTAAPYNFTVDTTSVTFGKAELTFTAHRGSETSTDTIDILVDNTAKTFPLTEDFESSNSSFIGIDVKKFGLPLLQQIKTYPGPGANWTQNDILQNGPASWGIEATGGYQSSGCAHLGTPGNNYGKYEIDALVSRAIDLTAATSPTLTFYHHYNIEDGGQAYDRGYCCVTDNGGQTYEVMPLRSGGNTQWTGNLPDYALAEVNLGQFAGKVVHVLLVFESNGQTAGEVAGPSGWWVDHLTVAGGYATALPTINSVSVPRWSIYGSVPDKTTLTISPVSAKNVTKVRYILDVKPLNSISPPDVQIEVNTAPFTATINLPNVPNQLAQIKVDCWGAGNLAGPSLLVPLYLFNLAGDANADNIVDQLDLDMISARLGLAKGETGFSLFSDNNMDEVINELDGAAVGYTWGDSI